MTDYTIKYGDTLSQIAATNNTTVSNLMTLNPYITDPNKIYAGKTLALSSPTTSQYTQPSTATIPTSTLQSQTPMTIPTTTPTNTADALAAGANQFTTQNTKAISDAQAAQSETQKSYDSLSNEISSLLGTTVGRGAAQLSAEQSAGLPAKQEAINAINSQITTKLAEYKQLQTTAQENMNKDLMKTIPLSLARGQAAEVQRALDLQKNSFASDIGLLQAQAQLLQGQYDMAKQTADRAVDLRYEDAQTLLDVKFKQLDLIKGKLTAQEKTTSDLLTKQYQAQKDQLAITVANEKDKNATLLNAMQTYPDANISLTDTIEQANAKIVANSQIYAKSISSKTGGTSGGSTTSPTESTTYQRIVSGNGSLSDLTPTEKTKVENQLYTDGYYSETPPQWFITQTQESLQQSISSEKMKILWNDYRNKVIGGSTSSSSSETLF